MPLPPLARAFVRFTLPALSLLPVLSVACTLEGAADEDCFRGKCDDGSDVRSQLDGLDEPIADWLRASPMTRDGVLETDYMAAMEQLATFSGCDIDSLKTYIVNDDLVAGTPFPRLISTLCSDDETRASSLFVAASFADPDNPDDVDPRNLEMFAWDDTARRNVFYALTPVAGSDTEVRVEVEPKACEKCHRNSSSLDDVGMPMVPIMNELVTPWPHWNAEPAFPSHSFELPDAVKSQPVFAELTAGARLGSASDLEQFIRANQTGRVIPERLKRRRDKPATVEAAMAMLRPLYCDEQVNYVTEDHSSNVMPVDVIVAGGIRDMFLAIQPSDWPWVWLNDGKMRFGASSSDPLTLIPVRGNLDVEYVRRLVAVRAISAENVLRVQALDWTRPVFSEFRCDLWKSARARLRQNPPALTSDMRNLDLLPALYAEIMSLDGEVSLILGDDAGVDTRLLALADASADADAVKSAIADGKLDLASCQGSAGFCAADMMGFGAMLDGHVTALENGGREMIAQSAIERFCIVREDFPNRPALPFGSCEQRPRHSPQNESTDMGMSDFLAPAEGISDEVRLIPDAGAEGITSSLEVPLGSHTTFVGALRVRVQIDHSWRGDLSLCLQAPDGSMLDVVSFEPGDSANDVDAVFNVFGFTDPMIGTGTWSLTVVDSALGERGHLLGWSLGVNTEAPALSDGLRDAPR